MINMFKKIIFTLITFLVGTGLVFADSMGGITAPTLWKKVGNTVQLVNDSWSLQVTDLTIEGSLIFGGISAGDLDMAGNNILNTGYIEGDSAPVKISSDGAINYVTIGHDSTNGVINTSSGDVQFDASILAGAYEFATAVQATFLSAMDIDCGASMTAGDQCSYIFKVDSLDFLKMYAQSDGSGGTQKEQVRALQEFYTVSSVKRKQTQVNAATYDVLPTDYFLAVDYTSTGAVTSLTLPTAQCNDSFDNGREIIVKDTGGNASVNTITIDTEGSETIDGSIEKVLNVNYNAVPLSCYNSNWYIF
jgi:hypothetical protein